MFRHLKRRLIITISIFSCIVFAMIGSHIYSSSSKNTITVGAKNNTEQHIIGEIIAAYIETTTDLKVSRVFNLEGTTVSFNSLLSGGIDVYCEYTGTALTSILHESSSADRGKILKYLKECFSNKYKIKWLTPLGYQNRYAILMDREKAHALGVKSISDLSKQAGLLSHLKIAFDPEFFARDEHQVLKNQYAFHPLNPVKIMDQAILYLTLRQRGLDAISASSTDGLISIQNLTVLEDDLKVFPPYDAVPLIREATLKRYPFLQPLLENLGGRFTDEKVRKMNYQVEKKEKSVYEVAREFLKNENLT